MNEPHEGLIRAELEADLERNVARFKTILNSPVNADAQFRMFDTPRGRICAIYMEGMADDRKISDFVLRACARNPLPSGAPLSAETLAAQVVEIAQCQREARVEAILSAVVTGMTAVLIEGCGEALLMETRGWPARAVDRTANESVVIGAQEGFVESLRTNMTLLRRYLPSPHLVAECLSVGTKVPCRVALCYLDGVADGKLIDRARRRLMAVDAPVVQGLGAIQQLIEDNPLALLPQLLQTERPDRAASCLADGHIVILADNSPCALIAPATLFHQLHASDDHFARWQVGSFLRLVRLAGILISVFLPGFYIALTDYHMHLLPLPLLASIAEARANVPFPILVEVLIMEFSFYLINEAGTRMPRQIGSALGIVGALILGQAAVSASIISPILIIIVALTGLGSYAAPDYGFSLALVIDRLFVILMSALMGLYGFCIAAFALLAGVCGLTSLGEPYVAPVAPPRPHNPDILLRLPVWLQRRRMFYARRDNWLRGEDDGP